VEIDIGADAGPFGLPGLRELIATPDLTYNGDHNDLA
jgi:hypothetical protein